jgi:hypothetical protein
MNRVELLTLVVGRARTNGFEFRRWYTGYVGMPWISAEAALNLLDTQRRYFALLFSHEFASAFWKAGEEITFAVPEQSFTRIMEDGSTRTVTRKPFTRRSARKDAWKYHLREMAMSGEPLRYIRKYLNIEDDLSDDIAAAMASSDMAAVAPKPAPPPPKRPKYAANPHYLRNVPEPEVKYKRRVRSKPDPNAPIKRVSREKPIAKPLPTGVPDFLKRPYPWKTE